MILSAASRLLKKDVVAVTDIVPEVIVMLTLGATTFVERPSWSWIWPSQCCEAVSAVPVGVGVEMAAAPSNSPWSVTGRAAEVKLREAFPDLMPEEQDI